MSVELGLTSIFANFTADSIVINQGQTDYSNIGIYNIKITLVNEMGSKSTYLIQLQVLAIDQLIENAINQDFGYGKDFNDAMI